MRLPANHDEIAGEVAQQNVIPLLTGDPLGLSVRCTDLPLIAHRHSAMAIESGPILTRPYTHLRAGYKPAGRDYALLALATPSTTNNGSQQMAHASPSGAAVNLAPDSS